MATPLHHPNKIFMVPPTIHRPQNLLITCAKEKEKQLRRPQASSRLPVDRWFPIRFMSHSTYKVISNEFRSLEKKMNAWEATANPVRREQNYLKTAVGGNAMRRNITNANLVGGGDYPNYIACEGPCSETVYDFWTMIWQEGISRIVSVNFPYEERLHGNLYQRETVQYWPMRTGEVYFYLPFKIVCLESRMMVEPGKMAKSEEEMVYRVSRLLIRHENRILGKQPDRIITHVCYYRWPDGSIPAPWPLNEGSYRESAIGLVNIIEKELPPVDCSPLVVHCHAGIGRTGVVIAVGMAMHQLRKSKSVNIKEVVEQLRFKRPRSVMNPWQYVLIHLLVAEKALEEGLISENVDEQRTRHMLDRVWWDMEAEVTTVFGDRLLTHVPGLGSD